MITGTDRIAVLVAAGGSGWESEALRELERGGIVVLKRCVDLADLMATAAAGQAEVAVVSPDLPGLDAAALTHLLKYDVRTIAVGPQSAGDQARSLRRIGVIEQVAEGELVGLVDAVRRGRAADLVPDPDPDPEIPVVDPGQPGGRTIVVWGPGGAPGRTSVAVNVAAELALRRSREDRRVVLADLDPYGGSVAQQLGILDEVSGLLAAARLVNTGELDERRFAATRRLIEKRLEILIGLPRADRWIEVRDGVATELIERAAAHADVVVDTGFCLEDNEGDFGRAYGGRNRMTLESLMCADQVLVVGSADPVGLTRLARGLVELGERVPGVPLRVVVNRMRDNLGWKEADIRGMIEGFVRPLGTHFLPEDRAACDKAVVTGQSLVECGDSPLRRALNTVVDEVMPETATAGSARRGSTARLRVGRRRAG